MATDGKLIVSRFKGWTLIILPFILFIIFVFSCAWTYPIFKLNDGGRRYGIGAQGYTVDGAPTYGLTSTTSSQMTKTGYLYDVPFSWPDVAKQVPPVLVAHLVLSILLALQLGLTAVILFRPLAEGTKRHERIIHPWLLIVGALTTLFALACSAFLGSLWGRAKIQGVKMHPDVLGYFVIVVGMLLEILWVLLVAWVHCCGSWSVEYVVKGSDGRKKYHTDTDPSRFDRLIGKASKP